MAKLPENTEHIGAVGALVTCEIRDEKYAILQKRPRYKPDGFPESFPGCLQVTIHGRLESVDRVQGRMKGSILAGLLRETQEEVAEMIRRSHFYDEPELSEDYHERDCLQDSSKDPKIFFTGAKMLAVSRKTKIPDKPKEIPVKKTDVTLGFNLSRDIDDINPHFIPAIQQLQRDGVIVLLSKSDIGKLVPINSKLHRERGVTDEGKYGMHPDEIEAVKKVLEVKV